MYIYTERGYIPVLYIKCREGDRKRERERERERERDRLPAMCMHSSSNRRIVNPPVCPRKAQKAQ